MIVVRFELNSKVLTLKQVLGTDGALMPVIVQQNLIRRKDDDSG